MPKNSDLVSPGAILAPASVGPQGRGDSLRLKLRYVEVSRPGAAYKASGFQLPLLLSHLQASSIINAESFVADSGCKHSCRGLNLICGPASLRQTASKSEAMAREGRLEQGLTAPT